MMATSVFNELTSGRNEILTAKYIAYFESGAYIFIILFGPFIETSFLMEDVELL